MIATLFVNPITLSNQAVLWLILPLCLSVAIIYKTIRTRNLRRLPLEIASLMAYMVGGLVLLGAVLWGILYICV